MRRFAKQLSSLTKGLVKRFEVKNTKCVADCKKKFTKKLQMDCFSRCANLYRDDVNHMFGQLVEYVKTRNVELLNND